MPLRLAAPSVAVALIAGLMAGCGDSTAETDGMRIGTVTGEARTPSPDKAPIGAAAKACDAHATDTESLRATNLPCDQARQVLYGWQRERACAVPTDASRESCLTRSYRCQSARTGRGLAVSCARQGQSIAFIAKP